MLVEKGLPISGSKVLVMGFAFKENCPDVRNSKVFEITANLVEYGFDVDLFDPIVASDESFESKKGERIQKINTNYYDAIIIAVAHDVFKQLGAEKIKS